MLAIGWDRELELWDVSGATRRRDQPSRRPAEAARFSPGLESTAARLGLNWPSVRQQSGFQ